MHKQVIDPQKIRNAPPKKLRIIHTDARDHWPTPLGDYDGINEARVPLRKMSSMELQEISVHDEQGCRIAIEL